MEETNLEETFGNFDRPFKFRVNECPTNCDRISDLPDSLLLHILSFLSADDAISTGLLSKRWKNLWKWMDTLEFRFRNPSKYKKSLNQFITRALSLHEGLKIKRFCAQFLYNSNHTSQIDSWVHYAIDRNVENLSLDLICLDNNMAPYVLPRSIYNCRSLRELKVTFCSFRPPSSFSLRSLQKLVVSNTVFNGNSLRDFVCGCPNLEELVLVNCNQARDLVVFILNRNLKRLRIVEFPVELEEGTEVKIYAPYLLNLEIHSGDPRPYNILDASSICSAGVYIRRMESCLSIGSYNQKNCFQVIEKILAGLREVKTLRLSSWCVQAMMIHEDIPRNLQTPFRSLKHLNLTVKLSKDELPGIAFLLWNSPELQTLTIQLSKKTLMDKEKNDSTANANPSLSNWNEDNFWDRHQTPFYSLKHNLKKVVIENFNGEENEIQFLAFLLKSSLVLNKLLILVQPKSFNGSIEAYLEHCGKIRRFSKVYIENIRRLMASPRSQHTEILFSGSHYSCC